MDSNCVLCVCVQMPALRLDTNAGDVTKWGRCNGELSIWPQRAETGVRKKGGRVKCTQNSACDPSQKGKNKRCICPTSNCSMAKPCLVSKKTLPSNYSRLANSSSMHTHMIHLITTSLSIRQIVPIIHVEIRGRRRQRGSLANTNQCGTATLGETKPLLNNELEKNAAFPTPVGPLPQPQPCQFMQHLSIRRALTWQLGATEGC